MKIYRLQLVTIVILLCIASGLVLAQDFPAFGPPAEPLRTCADDDLDSQVCDMLATQTEDIVGIWSGYFAAEPAFIRYNADGTWVMADTVENFSDVSVEGYPTGTYSFDEEGVFTTLDTTGELPEDCQAGHYLLRVIKVAGQPVALDMSMLDDCFGPRSQDYAYTLIRVNSE